MCTLSLQVSVEIDGTERVSGSTSGNFNMLTSNLLYLGGSPSTHQLPGTSVKANFRGCMKQVSNH